MESKRTTYLFRWNLACIAVIALSSSDRRLLSVNVVSAGVPSQNAVQQKVEKRHASTAFKWQVRLVNATLPYEGRVEVKITPNGEWGSVCDDDWDAYDAQVVCRMLGFNHAKARAVHGSKIYGPAASSAPIHLDEVRCTGEERTLADCDYSAVHNCEHVEDAGVLCQGAMEDHFENTAQLPKVFEHIQTLTNYFDTLRHAHVLLKNETDELWRYLNETAAEQNRSNAAQNGIIQHQIVAYMDKTGHSGGFGNVNASEAAMLLNNTAQLLITVPNLEQKLLTLEAKVVIVEKTLVHAVNRSGVMHSDDLTDAAERKIARLDERVQHLTSYLYWGIFTVCTALLLALLLGVIVLAYRNSAAHRLAASVTDKAAAYRPDTFTRENSSRSDNNVHPQCLPQQQGARMEYNASQFSNFNNKNIMSYKRPPPPAVVQTGNIMHMTSFFNGSPSSNNVSLPATPTSLASNHPQLHQQSGRQSHNSGGMMLPPRSHVALPPVPAQQQHQQFLQNQAALQLLQQQQQSDANHRAAMLALAHQQQQQQAGCNTSNYGYESEPQNALRYSLIMPDSSVASDGDLSQPATPTYSSDTTTIVPSTPQYADPYSIGAAQSPPTQQKHNFLMLSPAAGNVLLHHQQSTVL